MLKATKSSFSVFTLFFAIVGMLLPLYEVSHTAGEA